MMSWLVFCFLSTQLYFASTEELHLPKISFRRVSSGWQNLTLDDFSKPAFYSPDIGGDLVLVCEAEFPIRWNIYGFLSPINALNFPPPTRNFTENKFSIFVNAYFIAGKNFPDSGASARIACEKVNEPAVQDSIYAFVQGNSTFPFTPQTSGFILESKILPCATKNPRIVPTLFTLTENVS